MSRRWLKRGLVSGAIAGVVFLAVTLWLLRPAHVKAVVVSGLSAHLHLDASLETVAVQLFPRPRISGTGLRLRIPDRPDLPPFVEIDHFTMAVGLLSMLRKHVNTVHAGGLRVAVPPAGSRGALPSRSGGAVREVVIDHFVTHDAELRFVPRTADRRPLTFAIHDLDIRGVGFGLPMPFTATLTNPVPRGRVTARGELGPVLTTGAEDTPVSGEYRFEHADLSTINGLGGTLESTGRFSGSLTAITATGDATVPDFSLDLGGKPVPLTARFEALVNGTNGTTHLTHVTAVLLGTTMAVTGAISNLPGPGRHDVDLTVGITDGRIEDLLSLVLDTPAPVMTGDVTAKARLLLPPGPNRVRERLQITGSFGLTETRFTDAQVQAKLDTLSRRSRGHGDDDSIGRVLTNLQGQVALANATARLTHVSFRVPGARVALDGSYAVASGALDLRGTLRMQATVSQAVGGFKSIFLKPFDPIFRKNGAGAVLPIRISGSREAPKFGLDAGRLFKGN